MAMDYDRRRPRVPVELAERIDVLRGGIPYERWVREALETTVRQSTSEQAQGLRPAKAVEKVSEPVERPESLRGASSASSRASYVKPFNPRPKSKS